MQANQMDDIVDSQLFRMQQDLSHISIFEHHSLLAKTTSDSGVSSAEPPLHEVPAISNTHNMMNGMERSCSRGGMPRMPGSWYFEGGDGCSSPVPAHDDEFGLRAALSSRNITESVQVPSSEHVAEIVGRQGCKIKSLRAKTNTYIKTPIRGEEPIFTVTGKAEDVFEARKEIECAADHFSQIRASRRHSHDGTGGVVAPGHVTAYVRVPLRVVGLVVGPKGATIKRIQQDTNTYIITPSRDREPVFEVTGLPHKVEQARKEIEQHIYIRTGNMPLTDPASSLHQYEMATRVAAQYAAMSNQLASLDPAALSAVLAQRTLAAAAPQLLAAAAASAQNELDLNSMLRGMSTGVARRTPPLSSMGAAPSAVRPSAWPPSAGSLGVFTGQNGQRNSADGNAWGSSVSSWSPFGEPAKVVNRDEGLGDSPPTSGNGSGWNDPMHMMSIWSEMEAAGMSSQPASDVPSVATA